MEAYLDESALSPPATSEFVKEEEPTSSQTQTAGQADTEEAYPTHTTAKKAKAEEQNTDLLDEVADMNIPKTINADMSSFEEDNRANEVVSPDGSTYDGTSTIGSAASEPTTETGISRGKSSGTKKPTSGGSRAGSRGGNSRGGNSKSGNSSRGGSRTSSNNNASSSPTASSTPRRSYRNAYSSGNRMSQSTVPRPFKRPGPLSYSKAVRLSGSGSPFGGREVDDKTRAVLADMNEFDSAQLETQNIAADIFAPGTGISDDEIRKIMRVRVSSKQMELEQQVAAGNKVIKRLKDTLTALTKGKNEYIHRAIDAEKACRGGWASALETAQLLDEDRGFFKQKVKQLEVDNTIWKDNAKDTMRELSLSEDKMQNLRNEIDDLKQKVAEAENSGTQALIALEVEKARSKESKKNQQEWRDSQMANQMSRSNGRNKEQDEEMQKMIKDETDKLKRDLGNKKDRIKELENELVLSESQFARAVADSEAASSRANSKDKDMTELMKSIQEIQSQAQKREEEANRQRREAEKKVSELEKGWNRIDRR
jgi:hypothetical protein